MAVDVVTEIVIERPLAEVAAYAGELLTRARQREPERADLALLIGRYELLIGGAGAERILSHWRRAREVEPLLRIPEEFVREFKAAYGERPDLEAVLGGE